MIKVIAFDFGNVTYKLDNKFFISGLLKYSSLGYTRLHREILNSSDYKLFETGKISFDEYFGRTKKRIKLSVRKEIFIKLFNNRFTEIESTYNLIKRLHLKYILLLCSNTNDINFSQVIKKSRAFKFFYGSVTSFKVGYLKPRSAVYLEVIRIADYEPEEILFIDDKKININGARKLGIRAIQYKSYRSLINDLLKYKIKV